MHTCDNPGCINPDHLKLGTYTDNVQDMITKGRQVIADRTGEKNPRAKLTASDVAAIKLRYRTESAPTIAKDYNVSISTICRIANGAIWKSVS